MSLESKYLLLGKLRLEIWKLPMKEQ